jgi:hypothetical protein
MNQLKRQLQSLLNSLKALTEKTQKIAKEVDRLEKAQAKAQKQSKAKPKPSAKAKPVKKAPSAKAAAKKSPAKKAPAKKAPARKAPARKAPAKEVSAKEDAETSGKTTGIDVVLDIIKNSENGVTTAQIREMTGFSQRKIWDIVNRAKKEGKIKSERRGVYTSA